MELLDRMLEVVPGDLTRFFFANSGSEAVENAIKIARGHTGKTNIICFDVPPPPPLLACNDLMRFSSSIVSHDSGDTEHIIAKEMVTSSMPASLTGAADPPPEAMFPPCSMQQRVQSVNLQGTCCQVQTADVCRQECPTLVLCLTRIRQRSECEADAQSCQK